MKVNTSLSEITDIHKVADIQHRALKWLSGDHHTVGLSAKFMLFKFIGVETSGINYPRDIHDFRRCMMMIDRIPEARYAFKSISETSNTWRMLINDWEKIEASIVLSLAGSNIQNWDWNINNRCDKAHSMIHNIVYKKR